MFAYYLQLAWRSLKRSPGITALMVLSIGVGVALAMATWQIQHVLQRDPIPQKSAEIYFPTVDMWGPTAHAKVSNDHSPPDMLDYDVAKALLHDHRARYQAALFAINPAIVPAASTEHPFHAFGFAVSSEFFSLADVPFKYGNAWSNADDTARAQVVVISQTLNQRLFGGADSVGKTITINGGNYQIAGVLGNWHPHPTYYDIPALGSVLGRPPEVFVPFPTAIAAELSHRGNTICFKSPSGKGYAAFLRSSCAWISYLVQLDTPAAVQDYKNYLEGFAHQHFSWPPNVRLYGFSAWSNHTGATQGPQQLLGVIGIGLLIVCLVDTIGLMLAKFLRRSTEIGIRRALGATRGAIYAQFLTEAGLIGVGGGLLGIFFAWLTLLWMRTRVPTGWRWIMHVDPQLLALTVAVAIVATVLAALYPAWRAAHIQPAWQIKSN
ncbi:MAG TPA: ABC transporter permease [Rhodanobacteraceae bacterium]